MKKKEMRIKERDFIDLIQCYYGTRDSDDSHILERSDKIVDEIKERYKKQYLKPKKSPYPLPKMRFKKR